jgi:DNA polymerase I
MAENMGYEVLHGIVDCLWVIGEPISVFKEAVERETGILTGSGHLRRDHLPAHERWRRS